MSQLSWLNDVLDFPDTTTALSDPNGLLAVGGDLSVERLVCAYKRGIFPWFSDDQPILWWSPSPRMTLAPADLHIGRTLRKQLNKKALKITADVAFAQVIEECSMIERADQEGTWITQDMVDAYTALHDAGHAHSIEAWQDGKLVGGLYGVAIGGAFFGESMFSVVSGASKIAFSTLVKQLDKWGYTLVDCQIHTDYLYSFGAREMTRGDFEAQLAIAIEKPYIDWRTHWNMPEFGVD